MAHNVNNIIHIDSNVTWYSGWHEESDRTVLDFLKDYPEIIIGQVYDNDKSFTLTDAISFVDEGDAVMAELSYGSRMTIPEVKKLLEDMYGER